MKTARSAPIAFRFEPTTKAALSLIADREGRSMANMMEWLIRKHCEKESLGWPPAGAVVAELSKPKKPTSAKKPAASSGKKSKGTQEA